MAESTFDLILGETNFRNQRVRFGIREDDRRRHTYIIGKSGMGKSVLLENMAIQDMVAGRGLAFIDPHGDSVEKLLDFVPENRIKDVIYFDPSVLDQAIAFNPMENVTPDRRHLVASGLMSVFKKIWPDVWSARMEYILNNCLMALLEIPDATLLGIMRLLNDKDYRKYVIDQLTDPLIRDFWTKEFARYKEQFQTEAIAPIQNKIGQITMNPLLRNIVGQPHSTIDIRKIMDEGSIFLVNLSRGKIGEDNSRILGALLTTKLQLAAMSRIDIPDEKDRKDFYLYIDEFQHFATPAFASILAEARKFHLNLIVANQYISQMDETVRDAIVGNVGTMMVFRIGPDDAELFEKEMFPVFVVNDFVNLPRAQVAMKLMIDGATSPAFSAVTLPPTPLPEVSFRNEILRYTYATYSVPRERVDEIINEWLSTVFMSDKEASMQGEGGVAPDASHSSQPDSQRAMYSAICWNCGTETQIPFQPDPKRPVYCKNCLKLIQAGKIIPPTRPRATRPVVATSEDSIPATLAVAESVEGGAAPVVETTVYHAPQLDALLTPFAHNNPMPLENAGEEKEKEIDALRRSIAASLKSIE
ncbi:MAG: type IV secretion system DNA-binding domain-containing protein [Patescibacteria group bacterium]|nr:type IV secretion system DNA-binding domain-containing protein [Patescibacteria group bacterium]MDE2438306.1 type IV secretion system DNA-binding domain-containing protein [Patescibacteria group bacterium]